MKKRFYKGLQFIILFIVSIAVIPLISLSIYNASSDRKFQRDELKKKSIQMVDLTLMEEAQTIDGARQLLISLAALPEPYFSNSELAYDHITKLLSKYKRYLDFGILDRNGKIFSSASNKGIHKDFSSYEFFLEAVKYKEFSIGSYLIDSLTNKKVIHLGYPVIDKRGKIKEVFFAVFDATYIDNYEKALSKIFGVESIFIKIEEDGKILSTNLNSVNQINKILNQSLLDTIKKQEIGLIEAKGLYSQNYLFVFAGTNSSLFKEKLYLIVGTPANKFYENINKTLYRNLISIGILFVIILVAVLIITKKNILNPINKLIKSTSAMSVGNLKIKSNVSHELGEFGQLASAFDKMVESLEKQINEREFAESHLHIVLNNAPITIFAIDKNKKFTLSEGKGLERVNLKPGENVGILALDLYKSLKVIESNGNVTTGDDVINRVMNGESIRGITELRGVFFDNQFVPVRDSNKNIVGLIGVAIDITEKQKAENLLKESEEQFHNLFEYSPVSLWWEDFSEIKKHIDKLRASGVQDFRKYLNQYPDVLVNCVKMLKVVDVNNATLEMYQAKSKDELLQGLSRLFNQESYIIFKEELLALIEGKTSFECEANTLTSIGKRNDVILKLLILPGCEVTWSKVLVSIIDITERKKSEEEKSKLFLDVQKAEAQLRILSRRLIETQESERKKISRELHDEVGQTLTAAKIKLQSFQNYTKSHKTINELNAVIIYIEQSLQQIRDISLNLRPSILDDLGIEAAIRSLISRFTQITKIKFDFQYLIGDLKLPAELQLECYRITQEALNNIMKYAGAKNVSIILSIIDESLNLKIKDDGIGFNVQSAKSEALRGKSLGILSMEERVKLANGEFNIISSKDSGTELIAVFKLS